MNAASLKRAQEDVLERLKKEASSLARLRHPSILEFVEPVEETRSGGLMFATEPVTASLAGLLQDKDDEEKAGGFGGRTSRYVVEEANGKGRRRRELEIDELEIQKGLLQIGKGLEFLHESAGLVHGNLTPDAILVNAKSDWKISGLGYSGPPENSSKPTSVAPISLSEVLNYDPRLPRSVQLNLDYASPDFVLDSNVTTAADMFSLGLLIIGLYNSPHRSPVEVNGSQSAYKRLFSNPLSLPTQNNNFLSSQPLPKDVLTDLLPRLITRRPAQRLNAREFQQAQYFDNILVSTIRFLDSLPAKTPNEKSQFMRGLPRILNQFPKSVLEKKVLPALLDEMKDRDLLSLVLQNVFKIIAAMPSGKRSFTEKVIPRLREVFLSTSGAKGAAPERDSAKEAGLMVLLENMAIIAENSSGKEFKDDILPIIHHALESPTHSLVDVSLRSLPVVLPVLDFSTIKNELFPVISVVFSKTSSMGIKIRGLEALQTLCGGTPNQIASQSDDFSGVVGPSKPKQSSAAILDKYTIQEKVVPLLRGIKTKEPAVMMAALNVFQEVGRIADSDYLAMDVLPILWQFSLGPLLNLSQFQAYMALIKTLSSRIEQEQTRKLQELSSSNTATTAGSNDFMSFGAVDGANGTDATSGEETNFEALVRGGQLSSTDMINDSWSSATSRTASSSTTLPSHTRPPNPRSRSQQPSPAAAFSWSTPPSASPTQHSSNPLAPPHTTGGTIPPDHTLSAFAPLTPSTTTTSMNAASASAFSQPPFQPATPGMGMSMNSMRVLSPVSVNSPNYSQPMQPQTRAYSQGESVNWAAAVAPTLASGGGNWAQGQNQMNTTAQFAIAPPPSQSQYSSFSIAPPPVGSIGASMGAGGGLGMGRGGQQGQQTQQQWMGQGQKQGLDKYESLL